MLCCVVQRGKSEAAVVEIGAVCMCLDGHASGLGCRGEDEDEGMRMGMWMWRAICVAGGYGGGYGGEWLEAKFLWERLVFEYSHCL